MPLISFHRRRLRHLAPPLLIAACLVTTMIPTSAWADLTTPPARTWGTNGRVLTILPIGDRVYVGGTFSSVVDPDGVSYPAKNIAVFSATTGKADLSFAVKTNSTVTSLARAGGSIYLGGQFSTVSNGATNFPRNNLASIDAATGAVNGWAPVPSGGIVDYVAYAALTDSIYAGGLFTSVTGAGATVSPHPYIAKIDATTGAVDTAFSAIPNDRVRVLNPAADGSDRIYLGGDFLNVSGAPKSHALAAVRLTTGAPAPGFLAGPTNVTFYSPVFDITNDATQVYVAAGGGGGACTALDAVTGTQAWSAHTNGNAQAIRLVGPTVYCGGHFGGPSGIDNAPRDKLAALDSATGALQSFAPRINTPLGVWAVGTQAGDPNVYTGGDFTAINGLRQLRFATFLDTTRQGPPQAPGNFQAQPANSAVLLSWSTPSSNGGKVITSYQVFRSTTPGGEDLGHPLATLNGTTGISTQYVDSTAINDTTYFYMVLARNSYGRGQTSAEASATPSASIQATPPGAPLSVAATDPPGRISLTWNPPSSNGGSPVTSYNVYRGITAGGEDLTPHVTGVTATNFDDVFNLQAGTTYFYKITALNIAGEGPVSAEVSAIELAGKPGPPVLSGVVATDGVHLSWTAPPDGGSPLIRYVLIRDAVKLAPNLNPATSSYVDTTAATGVTYVYQIKAVNAQGAGPLSNKVTLTP